MPVPSSINDLSTTASSNSPPGNEQVFPELDNYLRFYASCIAILRDGKANRAGDTFTGNVTIQPAVGGGTMSVKVRNPSTGTGVFASLLLQTTTLSWDVGTEGNGRFYVYNGTRDCISIPSTGEVQLYKPNRADAAVGPNELVRKQELDAAVSGFSGSFATSSALAFSALSLSASGANANVSISAGELLVRNSSNGAPRLLSGLSNTLNTAASGANGLDTGTLAASTWYSVWVIWNGTTAASLLSLSATSPTLPSGYTHKARVGWIRTDGTANKYPFAFVQKGCVVQYVLAGALSTYPQMFYGTTSGAQALPVAAFCPTTAAAITVTWGVAGTGSGASMAVGPNAASSASATGFAFLGSSSNSFSGTNNTSILLESSNIYANSSNGNGYVGCTGWTDSL